MKHAGCESWLNHQAEKEICTLYGQQQTATLTVWRAATRWQLRITEDSPGRQLDEKASRRRRVPNAAARPNDHLAIRPDSVSTGLEPAEPATTIFHVAVEAGSSQERPWFLATETDRDSWSQYIPSSFCLAIASTPANSEGYFIMDRRD